MKSLNYRLLAVMLVGLFVPTIYSTFRIYFINSIPDTSSLGLAAQAAWLHLAYEVLSEAVVLPLYYVFGRVVENRTLLARRVTTVLIAAFALYGVYTALIYAGAGKIVSAMLVDVDILLVAKSYIRLEALGVLSGLLFEITVIVFFILGRTREAFWLIAARALLIIVTDSVFVGDYAWSLGMGVKGVAITNISVGLLLSGLAFVLLLRERLVALESIGFKDAWVRDWASKAYYVALEAGLRNAVFAWMILRLMNEVDEAGLYWVTNGFIWGWLLLPALALGQLMKQDAARHEGWLGRRARSYYLLAAGIAVLWIITLPQWRWFIESLLGYAEPERVASLALFSLPFYAVFIFSNLMNSYCYGVGRTDLVWWQSVIVNVGYYGIAYIAYLTGHFQPGLYSITLLFCGGMTLGAIVTTVQLFRHGYWRRMFSVQKG